MAEWGLDIERVATQGRQEMGPATGSIGLLISPANSKQSGFCWASLALEPDSQSLNPGSVTSWLISSPAPFLILSLPLFLIHTRG
jgi:hypothetical protein